MLDKYTVGEIYGLFVSCSLYLIANSILILVISALFLGGRAFSAGVGLLTGTSLMTFVYIIDRLDVTEEDEINNPRRSVLVRKYKTELLGITVLSLALFELSLAVSVFTPDVTGAVRVALGHVPLLVLYVYDDIKTVFLPLDSFAVAFTWGYQLVFIFVFISPLSVTLFEGATLFASWFLIVFAGLEARNVKDMEGDRECGKVTLAVIFGRKTTKRTEIALKSIGAVILVALSQSVFVFVLLAVHLLSLRFYSTLETDLRCQSTLLPVGDG